MTFRIGRYILLALLIILFFSASKTIGMYVDWLFFSETGFEAMFTKVLSAEVLTGVAFGAVFFLFVALNVFFASTIAVPAIDIMFMGQVKIPFDPAKFGRIFKLFGLFVAFFGGMVSAFWGSSLWPIVLSALHSVNTGKTDPIFGNDISFYFFKFPLYQALNGYTGFLLFFTILLVAVGYGVRGVFLMLNRRISFVKRAKEHLTFLIFLFFVKLYSIKDQADIF